MYHSPSKNLGVKGYNKFGAFSESKVPALMALVVFISGRNNIYNSASAIEVCLLLFIILVARLGENNYSIILYKKSAKRELGSAAHTHNASSQLYYQNTHTHILRSSSSVRARGCNNNILVCSAYKAWAGW
jgi:hypothetical protein